MSSANDLKEIYNADATVNGTTVSVDIGDLKTLAVQVNFTGAGDLVGVLELEASIDNEVFIPIDGSSQSVTSSGNHLWNETTAAYRYARATWTHTSGTGNIRILALMKRDTVTGA